MTQSLLTWKSSFLTVQCWLIWWHPSLLLVTARFSTPDLSVVNLLPALRHVLFYVSIEKVCVTQDFRHGHQRLCPVWRHNLDAIKWHATEVVFMPFHEIPWGHICSSQPLSVLEQLILKFKERNKPCFFFYILTCTNSFTFYPLLVIWFTLMHHWSLLCIHLSPVPHFLQSKQALDTAW